MIYAPVLAMIFTGILGVTTRARLPRFVVIGVFATGLHTVIASFLIAGSLQWGAGPANGLAFLAATTFSYIGNTLWTFSTVFSRENATRFVITAVCGYVISYSLDIDL